jgi:hypothetical protein
MCQSSTESCGIKAYYRWDRFDYTIAALSKEIIHLCFAATITQPDEEAPYTRLKEDLRQQHTLTKYQRIERFQRPRQPAAHAAAVGDDGTVPGR